MQTAPVRSDSSRLTQRHITYKLNCIDAATTNSAPKCINRSGLVYSRRQVTCQALWLQSLGVPLGPMVVTPRDNGRCGYRAPGVLAARKTPGRQDSLFVLLNACLLWVRSRLPCIPCTQLRNAHSSRGTRRVALHAKFSAVPQHSPVQTPRRSFHQLSSDDCG
jgi:hypothetical protein